MNNMRAIKRMLLVSIGILILTGATIHVQGGCKVSASDVVRADNAAYLEKGAF